MVLHVCCLLRLWWLGQRNPQMGKISISQSYCQRLAEVRQPLLLVWKSWHHRKVLIDSHVPLGEDPHKDQPPIKSTVRPGNGRGRGLRGKAGRAVTRFVSLALLTQHTSNPVVLWISCNIYRAYPGKHGYGKSPFLVAKSSISLLYKGYHHFER